jgi:3-deoxy-D-manno-octulosonic acid kinase
MPERRPQDPPVLQEHTRGRVTVYMNPDDPVTDAVPDLFDLPEHVAELEGRSTRIAGRPTSWHWEPGWAGPEGVHVRQYAHGGALGRWLGTVFLGEARMLDELRLTIRAERSGVPTATPLAVRIERVYGPFVRAHYVCRTIPRAPNILDYLHFGDADANMRPKVRREIATAVTDAVASMHDAGIVHSDLNLKNILLRTDGWPFRAWVIDFDKATMVDEVDLDTRISNLLRLERSFLKWPSSRPLARTTDRLHFLRTYLDRYPAWRHRLHQQALRCAR